MTTVRSERLDEHVVLVTLARPERLNAISFELVGDLHDALDEISGDDSCRVVILTGEGRGFCAGLDLRDHGRPPAPGEHPRAEVGVGGQEFIANLMIRLRELPQIVVGAVNGPAFGGGLSLACACDLRIAAESARFCSAFIRTGLSGTDAGISVLLPQIIGAGRALDLIVTGREIDASEAERLGLVSRVVPDTSLIDEARSWAGTIAGHTSIGLTLTKDAFWHNAPRGDLRAAIALENRNQRLAAESTEMQERMASYSDRHRSR